MLVAALKKVPLVDGHFMHNTLKAVFVDREGVYKDINQAYFRHLVAWMNYDMWYHQVPVDFCGMRNVFVGMDYHQFVAQASADANNTPEVWVKVYAPEGMSKMTKAEEDKMCEVDLQYGAGDSAAAGAAGALPAGADAGAAGADVDADAAGAGAGAAGAGAGKRQRSWGSGDDTEAEDEENHGKKRNKGKNRAAADAAAAPAAGAAAAPAAAAAAAPAAGAAAAPAGPGAAASGAGAWLPAGWDSIGNGDWRFNG